MVALASTRGAAGGRLSGVAAANSMITAPVNPAFRDDDSPSDGACLWCGHPFSCSPRRLASTILPSPVQDRVLVRSAPMGRACDRGRRADGQRPQEWGYDSVHAARRARFKGFAVRPYRIGAPRRQFPACRPRGERRRKLTGSLDNFLIAARPVAVDPIPQTRSGSRRCGVHPRHGLLLDIGPVLRSSTLLRQGSAEAAMPMPKAGRSEAPSARSAMNDDHLAAEPSPGASHRSPGSGRSWLT